MPEHLSKEGFIVLQNLSKNKDIVIRKSGEGNSAVTVDRKVYLNKIESPT